MHGEQHHAIPSDLAVRRLRSEVHRRMATYEVELEVDLTDIDRAIRTGRHALAAGVLAEHIQRLEDLQHELRRMLADAAVEREAEGVLDALVPDRVPLARAVRRRRRWGRRSTRVALSGSVLTTSLVAAALLLPRLPSSSA